MTHQFKVIQVDPEAYKSIIISLWQKNTHFTDADVATKKYIWCNDACNPGGTRKYWVLKSLGNNQIIGAISMSVRHYMVGDESFDFYRGADFMVDKEYRTILPAKLLITHVRDELKRENKSIIGCPNRASSAIMMRSGIKPIGIMSRYGKVLKSGKFITRKISSNILVQILSFPLDFILRILGKEVFHKVPLGQKIAHLEAYDNRFDDLWNRNSIDISIIGDRSANYLQWRYSNNPFQEYKIFAYVSKDDSKIYGYIIYYIDSDQAFISDMFGNDLNVIKSLLTQFSKFMRNIEVSSITISFFGAQIVRDMLRWAGFYERDGERKFIFSPAANTQSNSLMHDQENWYFTTGDEEEEN